MAQNDSQKGNTGVWAAVSPGDEPPPLPKAAGVTTPPPLRPTAQVSNEPLSLSQSLIDKKYHPVMIFGTAASGKSSILASLFHYLQNDPKSEAICLLGEWILPIDTKAGATVAEQVSAFFNRAVMSFNNGMAVPRTQTNTVPFFIPIILRPNNGKPDVRIAFLESSGENYQIEEQSVEYFPRIKYEILDVYQNFPYPLSILVVAPYTLKAAYTEQAIEEADDPIFKPVDQALYGALQTYQSNRRGLDIDHYMFVLTKWDVYTGGVGNSAFTNPPNGLVEKIIHERYRLAWTFYQSMPKSGRANSMQYSAGLISGENVIAVPDNQRSSIHMFPRALWNWIYRNAHGGAGLYGPSDEAKQKNGSSWLKKILS